MDLSWQLVTSRFTQAFFDLGTLIYKIDFGFYGTNREFKIKVYPT